MSVILGDAYKTRVGDDKQFIKDSNFDIYEIFVYSIYVKNENLEKESFAELKKIGIIDWKRIAISLSKILSFDTMEYALKKYPCMIIYMYNILSNCRNVRTIKQHYKNTYPHESVIENLCKLYAGTFLDDCFKEIILHYLKMNLK